MAKSYGQIFDEHKPPIDESDILAAADAGRVISSWNGKPIRDTDGKIISMAIKFAYADGATDTIIIERYPAHVLQILFETLEKADWKSDQIVPLKPN